MADPQPESALGSAPARRDLGPRVAVAAPALAAAIGLILAGGVIFACAVIALGLVALYELYTLMERAVPVRVAGFIALAGLCVAALAGGRNQVLLVLVGAVPLVFFGALTRPNRAHFAWAAAVTVFGLVWIGLPLAHAVLLRGLPHGRDLMFDVLFATFFGDSVAYFVGRAIGRHRLAPQISPHKTVEGMVAGICGAVLGVAGLGAVLGQDWLGFSDALILGASVGIAAVVGDLFESLIKRDLGVKDTGAFFGAHGGVVDRLDAALFTVVCGYYVSLALF